MGKKMEDSGKIGLNKINALISSGAHWSGPLPAPA